MVVAVPQRAAGQVVAGRVLDQITGSPIQMASVQPVVRNMCELAVYLDGLPMSYREADALVNPDDLEGVEIYRGIHEIPPEYHYREGCGVLLLWTRTDARKSKLTWPKLALGAALVGVVLIATASSN
ncbi:MAG: hypothetical protein ACREMA_04655 [Longimicrobiales bacterium]